VESICLVSSTVHYADDQVVISKSEKELQISTKTLNTIAKKIVLKIQHQNQI
jgi:hypothetical protein